jgi:hypothetical protein
MPYKIHDERANATLVPPTLTHEEAARRLASLAVYIHEEAPHYTAMLRAILHAHLILEHTPPVALRWTEPEGNERHAGYMNAAFVATFNDEASRLLDEIDAESSNQLSIEGDTPRRPRRPNSQDSWTNWSRWRWRSHASCARSARTTRTSTFTTRRSMDTGS